MKIGLAGWAINRRFRAKENPLKLLDFFRVAREEFGLDTVELNSPFMASREPDYLKAVVQAAKDAGVTMEGMAVDGSGDLSLLDEAKRAQSVQNAMAFFDVAERLGLKYFRVNTGGDPKGPPQMLDACIASFRQLAEEGQRRGIQIVTENHGGLSTDADMMVKLVKGVGLPSMGTLPDFGNFPEPVLIESLWKIMPYAAACHAKWTRRDAPGKRDIPAIMKMVKQSGFNGTVFVEDGGPTNDHIGTLELKGALMACVNSAVV